MTVVNHAKQQTARQLKQDGFAGAMHICIQSMDGQLSFYERETLTFSRFLPQFLLPGPLCYNQALDCFITCSSAFEVECYKYQTLAAAQAAAEKTTGLPEDLPYEGKLQALAQALMQHACDRRRADQQGQTAAYRVEVGIW